jgi:hypothetical protein
MRLALPLASLESSSWSLLSCADVLMRMSLCRGNHNAGVRANFGFVAPALPANQAMLAVWT